MGVNFVVFRDEHSESLRLWAVDLNLRMTSSACGFSLYSFLTRGGYLDTQTGTYNIGKSVQNQHVTPKLEEKQGKDELVSTNERAFCYVDFLGNPKFSLMQHAAFFNLCRLRGVSFFLKGMVGTAYKLVDSFVGGGAGMLCIETTREKSLMTMLEGLDFIRKDVGAFPPSMQAEMDWDYGEHNFSEVFKAVKEAAEGVKKKVKKRVKQTHL